MLKRHIQRFKDIYHQQFNVDLTDAQALEIATDLLNFYKAVLGEPIKANENNYDHTRREDSVESPTDRRDTGDNL